MKKLFTLLFLSVVCASWAQDSDIFSYYFHNGSFQVLDAVNQFDQDKFGKFELKEEAGKEARVAAGDWMIIDESGIYLQKNKLMTMPKSEVRENSKYTVRNGWMHGVMENDSVPCTLEEDIYYFLIPFKTYLFKKGSAPHKLIKINKSSYALFTYTDEGAYSVNVVQFTSGGMEMKEVEMTLKGERSIENIEKREEFDDNGDGLVTYVLNPTKQEWNSVIFTKCLVTYDSYQKVKTEEKTE
ncbi:MAG: hypothetical protein R2780_00430 [Crocinitomicaceae bacterium]|nr:hypothetical protein [Crocinitomicaceae bacterium]